MNEALREHVASLSPEALQGLVDRLQAGKRKHDPRPIRARAAASAAPLSFAQESLWVTHQLGLVGSAYNYPIVLELIGALNREALERALGEIVRRHQILRTRFVNDADGAGVQQVMPPQHVHLERAEIATTGANAGQALHRTLATLIARPIDLSQGEVFRCFLLEPEPGRNVLLLLMHHIVVDGWSLQVLFRELASLYESYVSGQGSSLPELEIQYSDYAVWQREWLQGEVLQQQLKYWKTQLAGAPATLELPTDRPRPALPSFRGDSLSFELSSEVTAGLNELARREGATLYMVLLAAFKVLLSRWSARQDIVVGSPIAGRTQRQTESLIGFFVNTLVMRTDLSGDPSFVDALARVKQTALGAYAHQDVPFEKLVAELQPDRDLSRQALFQATFALQNISVASIELPQLKLQPLDLPQGSAKFDLSMEVFETGERLLGRVEYATDLFDRGTIERMAQSLEQLLRSALADPTQPISRLQLMSAAERHRIVYEWNATQREYPQDVCVHELFAAQAQRTPEAIAVRFGDLATSYRELDERSNQLAQVLRERGVNEGHNVALLMERGIGMVVAQLAVLKAGAIYVPLDSELPHERAQLILDDCGAQLLLTENARDSEFSIRTIDLAADADAIAAAPKTPPTARVAATSAAYVMYTSGSTGRPKGVLVTHRAINRLNINNRLVALEPGDCVLHCSNPAFDAVTFEVWGALLNGGTLLVAPQKTMLQPAALKALLQTHHVHAMFVTAALFNQLVASDPEIFAGVDYVLCGGDVCDPAAARALLRSANAPTLINAYGPTEATTFAISFPVLDVPATCTNIPIGLPISNTTVYILDANREPVPIGVRGEIYLGGPGVALGYLNRAELTAARFVPDVFGADTTASLYRTGDIGSWTPEGTVLYHGREDHQVKIRGFRVEPQEVEAHLLRYPGIERAAVLADRINLHECVLRAYVVAQPAAISSENLRQHLRAHLPEYMVPGEIRLLEVLPLTPNGKLDRAQLLAMERHAPSDAPSAEPQTPLERELCELWAELLSFDSVGADADFFDLGGHSLAAMKAVARIAESIGPGTVLRDLFENPTPRQLARIVELRRSLSAGLASHSNEEQYEEGTV